MVKYCPSNLLIYFKTLKGGHQKNQQTKLRDECLNTHWFLSLDDAREKIETWRPEEYVKKHLKKSEISNLCGTAFG
jgi:hypothetical protein